MRLLTPAAVVSCCLLGACGTERLAVPEPNATLGPNAPTRAVDFPRAGVSARVPRAVVLTRTRPPGVFRFALASGAIVSVFAYRRKEPLPRGASELRDARRRLISAARRRDPKFRLESSRVLHAGGAPGVEVTGTQSLSGGRLETRSVHLYEGEGEYVLELIAPRADFGLADRLVFSPMLRSLELTGRIGASGRG